MEGMKEKEMEISENEKGEKGKPLSYRDGILAAIVILSNIKEEKEHTQWEDSAFGLSLHLLQRELERVDNEVAEPLTGEEEEEEEEEGSITMPMSPTPEIASIASKKEYIMGYL